MEAPIYKLAKEWLTYKVKGSIEDIQIMPTQTSAGQVVYFYDHKVGEHLDLFLTVPVVEQLLTGVNPKKVENKYLKK